MSTSAKLPGLQSNIITRREFVIDTLKKSGAIVMGVLTVSNLNSCSDDSNPTGASGVDSISIDLSEEKHLNLASVGGTLSIGSNGLDNNGLLLFRETDSLIKAYSRECTHQQCTLPSFQGGLSSCPCHGSRFNTNGAVINGPATSPLREYNTSLSGNILTISR